MGDYLLGASRSGFYGASRASEGYPFGLGWWSDSDRLGLVRGVLTLVGLSVIILLSVNEANVLDW